MGCFASNCSVPVSQTVIIKLLRNTASDFDKFSGIKDREVFLKFSNLSIIPHKDRQQQTVFCLQTYVEISCSASLEQSHCLIDTRQTHQKEQGKCKL